jgi:hypothetical protein
MCLKDIGQIVVRFVESSRGIGFCSWRQRVAVIFPNVNSWLLGSL